MVLVKQAILTVLFAFCALLTVAQTTINAGNDTTICLGGNATLHAAVTGGSYGTSSYTFEIIPYDPQPYIGGYVVDPDFVHCTASGHDDCWAGPYEIGFSFCFFNQYYTQFWVGSNGWIGFSDPTGHSWTTFTSAPIPNTAPTVPKNAIFCPWEDWYPTVGGINNVYYYNTGTAPNRKLVVYFKDCQLYGCTGGTNPPKGTFQIVINEQSSIVENHITLKPDCYGYTATQGVHNIDGTVGFTATGRNSTYWLASNESTRFVPSGIKWYTGGYPGGTIVGYGQILSVSPTVTTTYTAVVENCGGGNATDEVTVSVKDPSFTYPQQNYCQYDSDPTPFILQPGGLFSSSPGGLVFISNLTGSVDLSASLPGNYTVTYTITNPCTVSASHTLNIIGAPSAPVPLDDTVAGCGPGSLDLGVTLLPGQGVRWYDSPSGGIQVGTGTPLTVTVSASTWYYAESYTLVNNCTGPVRTAILAQIKPVPQVSNTTFSFGICSSSSTNIPLQSSPPGSTFSWTASCGASFITGYSDGSGSSISQVLFNSGTVTDSVLYLVTPLLNGCPGPASGIYVRVYPVPSVTFDPVSANICSAQHAAFTLSSPVAGTTFAWTATGDPGISGYSPGSGTTIDQVLNNSFFTPGDAIYTTLPSANGCPGPAGTAHATVRPMPLIAFPVCFPNPVTVTSLPIFLKGATPLGGTYSGPGVTGGIFTPASSGTGTHTLTYQYTNLYGCTGFASQPISVVNPPAFTCGNPFTDIRDNKSYPTVQIGTQCWMASNLDYGVAMTSAQVQRDNCVYEKYCYGDNPANCATFGGLYQWDEVMDYSAATGIQGICPSDWHIPSEPEWNALFNNYINNGFAGNPLKYTGFSGFNAFLSGVRFNNVQWDFANFAVLYWSSTFQGQRKAWAHGMNSYNPSVSFYPALRNHSFHVRCIHN